MPFQFQLALAGLQAVVQLVEMLLGLGDDALQAGHGLAGDLAVLELGKLHLLPVDQGVQADLHVPIDARHLMPCGPLLRSAIHGSSER